MPAARLADPGRPAAGALLPPAAGRPASLVDDEQLDHLREHPDLQLVAYSPVLKGLYDAAPEDRGAMWNYAPYAGDAAGARLATVDALAAELGVLPSQVVLAWMLASTRPRVIPLIGTTRVRRYEEALGALSLKLTPEQLATLDAA